MLSLENNLEKTLCMLTEMTLDDIVWCVFLAGGLQVANLSTTLKKLLDYEAEKHIARKIRGSWKQQNALLSHTK